MQCLLITPKRFYVFHEFLAGALESRGYKVSVVNDEYPENILGVLFGNFIPPLSNLFTLKFFRNYLSYNNIFDLVIIIKGRGVGVNTINLLKSHSKKIIGYNFDSFRYNPNPLQWMKKLDKYTTFDHRDSVDYNLQKVELFASTKDVGNIEKTTDLSIILKNHSDRLLYLDQVAALFSKIKTEIFIYERNVFTFIKNFLTHPLLILKWRKYISFKPLDYNSYLDMLKRSIFTLDFAHPKQSGTTIRCFESLACRTKIISNNKYILTNPAFNHNNVIIHPLNGDVEMLYRSMKKNKGMKCEFNSRSIDNFIDDLLQ